MSETQVAPCVLVVDDEWMNRELLEAYLVMGGYRVVLANSGEKALRLAQAEPPALVMLDVRLAGVAGMDGFEVCRCLKNDARTCRVPVLMVTALKSDDDQQQALAAGADGFIAKPFDSAALLGRVRSLINPA